MSKAKDIREMTASTIGKDILGALLDELRLLPKPWEQLPKTKQEDTIERLRKRVDHNVKMAVHLLAADGRTVVAGALDQITIKDGVKAVVKFSGAAPNLHDLFDVAGQEVLVVVANAADYTAGMNGYEGEDDQRAMDLGHEYHDNDGGGMDDDVVDAEFKPLGLPSPDQVKPSDAELDAAYEQGYKAAEEGKTKDEAPIVRHELVAQWVRGWSDWHEQNNKEAA